MKKGICPGYLFLCGTNWLSSGLFGIKAVGRAAVTVTVSIMSHEYMRSTEVMTEPR